MTHQKEKPIIVNIDQKVNLSKNNDEFVYILIHYKTDDNIGLTLNGD